MSMTIRDRTNRLEVFSNPKWACDWDNVGLHIGDYDGCVNSILLTVDVDDAAIKMALDNKIDMIISHHPFFFKGVKKLNSDTIEGRRTMKLISNGIAVYCMHTNFDCSHMAFEAAERMGITGASVLEEMGEGYGIGAIGNLKSETELGKVCKDVKSRFNIDTVAFYGNEKDLIKRVAICPGSGKDEIGLAVKKGADLIITGDVSYHFGIDGVADGIDIIDAGHYGIEHIFMDIVKNYFKNEIGGIKVMTMPLSNPQKYI